MCYLWDCMVGLVLKFCSWVFRLCVVFWWLVWSCFLCMLVLWCFWYVWVLYLGCMICSRVGEILFCCLDCIVCVVLDWLFWIYWLWWLFDFLDGSWCWNVLWCRLKLCGVVWLCWGLMCSRFCCVWGWKLLFCVYVMVLWNWVCLCWVRLCFGFLFWWLVWRNCECYFWVVKLYGLLFSVLGWYLLDMFFCCWVKEWCWVVMSCFCCLWVGSFVFCNNVVWNVWRLIVCFWCLRDVLIWMMLFFEVMCFLWKLRDCIYLILGSRIWFYWSVWCVLWIDWSYCCVLVWFLFWWLCELRLLWWFCVIDWVLDVSWGRFYFFLIVLGVVWFVIWISLWFVLFVWLWDCCFWVIVWE